MRALALMLLLGCGTPSASTGDASMTRTATLTSDVFSLPGPGLRLSDGALLAEGMGDVWLAQRSIVTMNAAAPLGICAVGTFDTLDAVPTSRDACVEVAPSAASIVSANQNGTNQWVGRAWLIFDDVEAASPRPIYRLRALDDSDENPHIVVTLEYEPLGR